MDGLDSINQDQVATANALQAKFAELAASRLPQNVRDPKTGALRPAELAFLNPDIPDTLLLTEILS